MIEHPSLVCTCRDPDKVYVNWGDVDHRWWVHTECGRPVEPWLRSLGDKMLNYFRGGEQDGKAYATSTLLDHQYLMEGYSWTPEVIISKKTGDTARVWRHASLPSDLATVIDQDRHDLVTIKQDDRRMPTMEKRRKALKISREKLAEMVGMSHAQIQRIESNGVRTTDEERQRIYDALDQLEGERTHKLWAATSSGSAAKTADG
jgi:hypothetical protein